MVLYSPEERGLKLTLTTMDWPPSMRPEEGLMLKVLSERREEVSIFQARSLFSGLVM